MILPKDAELVRLRREICAGCECKRYVRGLSGLLGIFCGVCKCIINAKTRLSGQRCPKGKW